MWRVRARVCGFVRVSEEIFSSGPATPEVRDGSGPLGIQGTHDKVAQ